MTALEARESTSGPTAALAAYVAELRFDDLDARTVHRAKSHLLDGIGAILGGANQEVTDIAERAASRSGGSGTVPVAGRRLPNDLLTAAFLHGAAAHGLELDDGYRAGSVHPGSVVVPALLAAGFTSAASGRQALVALVAGYEAMCRLAAACHPRSRWRGFHNTSTTGVFGAASVWSALCGFSPKLVEAAYGIAASTASGLFTFLDGGDVKRLHPGFATRSGLFAGILAEEGLASPPGVLESPNGFFHAYAGDGNGEIDYAALDILSIGPGSPHAITECYIKPYACCRHIHSPIDAVLDMRLRDGLTADAVRSIQIGTYRVATAHDLREWESFTTAQMSIPFVVASALRHGEIDLDHFSKECREDSETAALADRISVSVDAACDDDYPRTRSAVVTAETTDGRRIERRVDEPLGSPANQVDDDALLGKFLKLADPVLGTASATRVADTVMSLEVLDDIRPMVEALARPL